MDHGCAEGTGFPIIPLVMPRPLVFGNQKLLSALDARGRVRDLYFPRPGFANHIGGRAVAWGVYLEGRMFWSDQPDWTISMSYDKDSLVGRMTLQNDICGIRLETEESCHPDKPWIVRTVKVTNLRPRPRDLTLYFNHELWLDESPVGNTAVYLPHQGSMLHYKRTSCVGFALRGPKGMPSQWGTGVRTKPTEGSWRGAESGQLSMTGRDVGMPDSTLGVHIHLLPLGADEAKWMLAAGHSTVEVERSLDDLLTLSLSEFHKSNGRSDQEWLKSLELTPLSFLSERAAQTARTSLLLIRTQITLEGAVIAGNDSDCMAGGNTLNYSNVWPRDGALVAEALLQAGARDLSEDWVAWCVRYLPESGRFVQKYWADGTLGVSWHPYWLHGRVVEPIQIDETALSLWTAVRYVQSVLNQGGSVPEELLDWLVRPAEGCLTFIGEDGLPLPSWDLWEERRGVSFFAVSSLIAAFMEAAELFGTLGDEVLALRCQLAAERMREAALTKMVGSDGCFVRQLTEEGHQDKIVDAALVGGLVLGSFDLERPEVRATLDKVKRVLHNSSPSGGCPRYEGDYYHRMSEHYPGSPWFICSLWIAQLHLLLGDDPKLAEEILVWACDKAFSTGVMSESLHPETSEPLSVGPLTWSHAEFVRTALMLGSQLSSQQT